jgi:prephenate dehydratase
VAIATLGPKGTDADYLARTLTRRVFLEHSFRAALERAAEGECAALVACGCRSETETWVDLHFEFCSSLRIVQTFAAPTKTMCLASRHPGPFRHVAAYPAVWTLARRYAPEAEVIPCASKPDAVLACADGRADACIGSLDVATAHGLMIIEAFGATMAWTLYARPNAEALP